VRGTLLPDLPGSVWLLQVGGLLNAIGSGLVLPFVLVYLHTARGIPVATAGLVVGAFGFTGIAGAPLGGWAVDRIGARRTLAVSLVVLAAAYALLGFATRPWQALVLLAVAGVGNGGFWPSQSAYALALAGPERMHLASALGRTAGNLGIGLGALVGGALVAAGLGFSAIFALDGATFAVFAVLLVLLPAIARPAARTTRGGGYRRVLADRTFLLLLALNVCFVAAAYAPYESALPLFARDHAGLAASAIGAIFLVNSATIVVFQLPVARLLEGRSRLRSLAAMSVLWAVAFGLVPLAPELGGTAAVALLLVVSALFALGECALGAVVGPLVVGLAPEELRGRYLALLTNSYAVGFTIGPPIAAAVFALSPRGLWIGIVGACLVAAFGAVRLERRVPVEARLTPTSG
jgi:MFS family permease